MENLKKEGEGMVKQKIEVDIVTTTKIQAIINGKKRTLRMWRLPIPVPIIMRKHLKTYINDAKNDLICNMRTPQEWIDYIKSFSMKIGLRGWVTSVLWFHYGSGSDDMFYDYYRSFDGLNEYINSDKQVLWKQLDKMGISKVANGLALEREIRRNLKLDKILKLYTKGNKDE